MKIAVLSPGYPGEASSAFAFVHIRVKLYLASGQQVSVFVPAATASSAVFEGVPVHRGPASELEAAIRHFRPDVVGLFYPTLHTVPVARRVAVPTVVWVLGHEALWSLRLMPAKNSVDWIRKRVVLFPRLIYQMLVLRSVFRAARRCVFVSEWLRQAVQKQTASRFDNSVVIPNPVDTRLFAYRAPRVRNAGISVRSLERTVYGLDVAIKAFAGFDAARLAIYGQGRFYRKFVRMAQRLRANVEIHAEHIRHDELPELYHRFGFFVAPSRAETQGLAMCEAMACGLPVVATDVGGIPEFVRDGRDGYLVPRNNPAALRGAVERLLADEEKFMEMSQNARQQMERLCAAESVTERELTVLKESC